MCDPTPSSTVGVTSTPNSSAKHFLVRRFDGLLWGDVSLDVLLSWWGSEHAAPRSASSLDFAPFEAAASSFSGALAVPDFPPDVLPNIGIVVSNTVKNDSRNTTRVTTVCVDGVLSSYSCWSDGVPLIAPWIDVCVDGVAVPTHLSDEDSRSPVNILRSTCVE